MMTSTRTRSRTPSEHLRRLYARFEDAVIQPIFCLALIPVIYVWEKWHR